MNFQRQGMLHEAIMSVGQSRYISMQSSSASCTGPAEHHAQDHHKACNYAAQWSPPKHNRVCQNCHLHLDPPFWYILLRYLRKIMDPSPRCEKHKNSAPVFGSSGPLGLYAEHTYICTNMHEPFHIHGYYKKQVDGFAMFLHSHSTPVELLAPALSQSLTLLGPRWTIAPWEIARSMCTGQQNLEHPCESSNHSCPIPHQECHSRRTSLMAVPWTLNMLNACLFNQRSIPIVASATATQSCF